MDIRNASLLERLLARHGTPEGKAIDCFGTLDDPSDFVYFTVFPDRLRIAMRRILADVGSFQFHFVLRLREGRVAVERILHKVEGSNRRIRGALGEAYAKTSIGVPFGDLSEDEEQWVAIALKTFHRYWMKEPA